MRKKLVAGNWKMFTTPAEAEKLVDGIKGGVSQSDGIDVLVCPPFTSIPAVVAAVGGSILKVGGQNMHWEESGAYTGEISAKMLLTLGCSHVILGHSERRQYFFESDLTVNAKLKAALSTGLIPVVCVGETLEQREAGETNNVVKTQILGAFDQVSADDFQKAVIAYEPVWAIGTGKTATPEQAEEVHDFIRVILSERYADAESTIILYGGSVKPDNARELFTQPNIDGGLVGGASLKAESFVEIVRAARQ
jgi:triosephosphate isomerase